MKKLSGLSRFVLKELNHRVIASNPRERSNLAFKMRSPRTCHCLFFIEWLASTALASDINLRKARRLAYSGLAMMVLLMLMVPVLFPAEPVMKTLSAHVVKVAADNSSIDVDFRHPATGKVHRLTFYVDGQTGLSKLKSLDELRSGQIVNIDYVEGAKHRLLIRRIARVKLSGPPAGLEKFRGF